jgi:hypothetical protein
MMRPVAASLLASLACMSGAAAQDAGSPPALVLPVACEIGRTCFVQNYVDADPSPGSKDFTCGTRSYDKHNGTDFRLPSMDAQKRGVPVLSAAAGKVLRTRDGEPDVSVRQRGMENLDGRNCGNGLVIDHGDGWQTQYCHMARNSVVVKPGETVRAGQPLGRIGLSGETEYPHLHFTLRKGDRVVDPFALDAQPGACGTTSPRSAWAPAIREGLAYKARSVINAGFASSPVTMESIESGEAGRQPPNGQAQALVAFFRAIGLRKDDVHRIAIIAPDGTEFVKSEGRTLMRDEAQTFLFAGRKRPPSGYPSGEYKARYEVLSGGKVVLSAETSLRLRP